jgi:hypothetical protein
MAFSEKLGYAVVTNTTAIVKYTPAGFFGLTVVGAGNVAVYDGLSASGVLLYSKTGAAVGDVVHFGGNGISANTGLTVVATATVNVLYT